MRAPCAFESLHNRRGFTLTEVIIGMFILCVVAIALNTVLLTFIRSNSSSRETARATAMGNQKLEQLRTLPFNQVETGSDTVSGYFRSWQVTQQTADRRSVTVVVAWPPPNYTRSTRLSTIISRRQ